MLRESNQKIQEVMQLLSDGETRQTAKQKVQDAKDRAKTKSKGHGDLVFHPYQGKRTPVTQQASDSLALGDALELMLATSQHNADLHKALASSSRQRVDILERLLRRG